MEGGDGKEEDQVSVVIFSSSLCLLLIFRVLIAAWIRTDLLKVVFVCCIPISYSVNNLNTKIPHLTFFNVLKCSKIKLCVQASRLVSKNEGKNKANNIQS